ncbi:hypothetical protein Trydic_g18081 [Trypoxylus dichotomus]
MERDFQVPDQTQAKKLLSRDRKSIRTIVGLLTGYAQEAYQHLRLAYKAVKSSEESKINVVDLIKGRPQ